MPQEAVGFGSYWPIDESLKTTKDSDTTVGNILKAKGIEPAPERTKKTTWRTFLQAHWDVLAAIDFTTIEVWTTRSLAAFYLLFVMELKTRRAHFAGCTCNPDGPG